MLTDSEESIKSICEDIMKRYRTEPVSDAFTLVIKLLNNIITNPRDSKFRNFKKTNELIKSKILLIKENYTLMKLIGYEDVDAEMMTYKSEDVSKVKTAIKVIGDCNKQLLAVIEAEEINKREQEAKRLQDEVERKRKEDILRKQKIQESLEHDKKERALRDKAKDSVSNGLEFGAKVCKFEPKRGGG
jgi:hypothetical protein